MSMSHHAHQTEENFTARRLGNWESNPRYGTAKPTLRPKSGTTRPVVDANGHLLPGVARVNNAFSPPTELAVRMSCIVSLSFCVYIHILVLVLNRNNLRFLAGLIRTPPSTLAAPPPWATRASKPATCDALDR
jgi:hypothetical protein